MFVIFFLAEALIITLRAQDKSKVTKLDRPGTRLLAVTEACCCVDSNSSHFDLTHWQLPLYFPWYQQIDQNPLDRFA